MAKTKFIILARSRTGSTWLMKLLGSHPDITMYGEILGAGALRTGSKHAKANPVKFIKDVFRRGRVAVGFKLFYYHARGKTLGAIWEWLHRNKDVRVIHLKRKNILRTHVSKMLYCRKYKPRRIDFEGCLKAFEDTREYEKWGDEFFKDHRKMTVYYEDLQKNPRAVCIKIIKFLGLPPTSLRSRMKKENKKKLSQNITNYIELKEKFKDTGWSVFFED